MGINVRRVAPGSGILAPATFPVILLSVAALLTLPRAAEAATYTVCPTACDYTSPDTAVNDPVIVDGDTIDIHWINVDGESKQSDEWAESRAFTVLIEAIVSGGERTAAAIAINGGSDNTPLKLPLSEEGNDWRVTFTTGGSETVVNGRDINLPGLSLALLELA